MTFSGRARRRAGAGHHLCHRALRDEADAGRHRADRDRAGRRPAGAHPRSVGISADRFRQSEGHGRRSVRRGADRPRRCRRSRSACWKEPAMAEVNGFASNRGAIAILTVSRPEKLNAFDIDMLKALAAACDEVEANADVRVAILTGEGKAFSAGGDIKAWGGMEAERIRPCLGALRPPRLRAAGDAAHAADRGAERPCARRRAGTGGVRRYPHRRSADQDRPAGNRSRHDPRLVGHAAAGQALRRADRAAHGARRRDVLGRGGEGERHRRCRGRDRHVAGRGEGLCRAHREPRPGGTRNFAS